MRTGQYPAKARANASGASAVRYEGSPEVKKDVSGASSVTKK